MSPTTPTVSLVRRHLLLSGWIVGLRCGLRAGIAVKEPTCTNLLSVPLLITSVNKEVGLLLIEVVNSMWHLLVTTTTLKRTGHLRLWGLRSLIVLRKCPTVTQGFGLGADMTRSELLPCTPSIARTYTVVLAQILRVSSFLLGLCGRPVRI